MKELLGDGHDVWVLDNLSNGLERNLEEFSHNKYFKHFERGDIRDEVTLESVFKNRFDLCCHLAASINVQDSIDNPRETFENDTLGTFNVLEKCREFGVKMVFMSTCMVYDRAEDDRGIGEGSKVKPASPYAGSKLAGENMVLSYWYAYRLPVVVVRPFNTYGPFQKSGGEGGVVAVFIKRALEGLPLKVYGDGTQTRDLLYVEDCARFVVRAGYCESANGQIINAGLGSDISINRLAGMISEGSVETVHVEHIHPWSEIPRLLCNNGKAEKLLDWKPEIGLEEGIALTREWVSGKISLE